jgi:muconolactone delta-isomerase
MKILALEKEIPGTTKEAFKPYLAEEASKVWELYQSGVFRELYFRQDKPCAVLVLECDDVEATQEALDSLPLVREGLSAFDVIPLVAYPGFARLFG